MRLANRIRHIAALVSVAGLLVPAPDVFPDEVGTRSVSDASRPNRRHLPTDVALQAGGVLRGRLFGPDGSPLSHAQFELYQQDRLVRTVHCDTDGYFALHSLRGGVYRFSTEGIQGLLRLWAPRTAPPSARSHVMIVTGQVERAQMHPAAAIMGSPWFITGLVATAVIIPVSLQSNRDDRPEGS